MDLSLNKLPWYAQVLAFAGVAAAGWFAFWWFHVSPSSEELARRQTELDGLRVKINTALATARTLPEFQQEVANLEERLDALRAVLPEQKDVGDLLRRIQTLASQSSLTIRGFTPRPTTTQQMHAEWPIALQLEGTYHNLGFFFERVGKLQRIINISELKIQPKEPQNAGATIAAECVATTFVLLETPAGPGAPGGAAR